MAAELFVQVHGGGVALVPASEGDAEVLAELALLGGVFKASLTQPRNPGFHRKGMALFRVLFNLWEPGAEAVEGVPVRKDFESFREDVTISAGYWEQVFNADGSGFRLKAQSLSWGGMDNEKFQRVYSAVIDVGLRMIGKSEHLSREQVDAAVNRLLGFS